MTTTAFLQQHVTFLSWKTTSRYSLINAMPPPGDSRLEKRFKETDPPKNEHFIPHLHAILPCILCSFFLPENIKHVRQDVLILLLLSSKRPIEDLIYSAWSINHYLFSLQNYSDFLPNISAYRVKTKWGCIHEDEMLIFHLNYSFKWMWISVFVRVWEMFLVCILDARC